jgi:predicted DNA-binding transcriptional regulator AlpA
MSGRAVTLSEVRRWPAAVDVTQAAQALGISRSTAYQAISCGTFPAAVITVSRRKRVLTASLIAVLEGSGDRVASA